MQLDGYFINLDRSADRRRSLETQLASLGCDGRITRFPAIDGAAHGPFDNAAMNGIWACRQSHEDVIRISNDETATVVLEDDVEISREFPSVVNEHVLGQFVGAYPQCDLLFLDCCPFYAQVPLLLAQAELRMRGRAMSKSGGAERHGFSGVSVLDAKGTYAYCTASYVVTPKGKQTLRGLLSSSTDATTPIDILFRDWIASGALSALLTIPFLATPKFESVSTMPYEELESPLLERREGQLINGIRRLLFAGDADLDMREIASLLPVVESSSEYRLGMQLYEACRTTY